MKKQLLFFAIALMALVTGCKKESTPETKLVEGVELPPLTEQFAEGSPITVKGSGFTQADQIAFRTPTKASTDIVAEVTEVGATQITFIVPSGLTAGETPIVLKRGGIEQVLGPVMIAELAESSLYGFGWPYGRTHCVVYQINRKTGEITEIKELSDNEDMSASIVLGHNAYGVNFPKRIGSFNFDTKSYKDLGEVANLDCLGVIDGKLHVITSNQGSISLSQVNTETGALTLVADFGKVANAETFTNTESAPFVFDVSNNTVLTIGWWYDRSQNDEYSRIIALNLTSKSISLTSRPSNKETAFWNLFSRRDVIYSTMQSPKSNGWFDFDIYDLNTGYNINQKLTTIKEACFSWQYDSKDDMMYSVYDYSEAHDGQHGLCSFDFKTSQVKVMVPYTPVDNVVLVR